MKANFSEVWRALASPTYKRGRTTLFSNHRMSLVSGPGRAAASSALPDEIQLAVEAHVKYIQSLDTVRSFNRTSARWMTDKMAAERRT